MGALLLVAAAVAVHLTTPDDDEQVAPFVLTADVGDWAQARTFGLRVEEVALAAEVGDGEWTGSTDGVWVVVTATGDAALEPGALRPSLFLGDEQFDASERPGSSALTDTDLSPGLPVRGDLVFEVTAQALREHGADAVLQVADTASPRLDTVVEVALDLAGLETEPSHELTPLERGER